MKIVSIGEALWDVMGSAEHLGGAPLNFAIHTHRLGHDVRFVSAVGCDARGEGILDKMSAMGLATDYVSRIEEYPTGTAAVAVNAAGDPEFIIHRPAAYDFPQISNEALQSLHSFAPDWIYYGTLAQQSIQVRNITDSLLQSTRARRFYDVNLRPASFDAELVRELLAKAQVVKLNSPERLMIEEICGEPYGGIESFCRDYTERFGWQGVCITRSAEGCCLLLGNEYCEKPGYRILMCDAIGAGDAFAAALVHGIESGWPCDRIADFANRAAAMVVSRPGATPDWTIEEALALKA